MHFFYHEQFFGTLCSVKTRKKNFCHAAGAYLADKLVASDTLHGVIQWSNYKAAIITILETFTSRFFECFSSFLSLANQLSQKIDPHIQGS
jgi:hypothetical protein